ncbi:response regulator transcription factor [Terrisporobacter petrolearius]|uniref:response regulator transcription factor n=1 Tax=Terrisporobacter petrolearius TaxID=1460447 RepID=UPI001D16CB59|nr:response regulator transcription factor [Terrisporobacter petrolearius]MCC3863751.1 response regulator transcription factor [Terrisporobacter petrolearius]
MEKEIQILVVEDDNDINKLLCNIIKKSGYTAQAAYSGTEAMLYVEKQEWDMVLLDLMLPGITGEEVLLRIREHSLVPVIIISAKGEAQTKVNILRVGADDYITKPFDIEEVSARIDSLLRRYKQVINQGQNHVLKHKDVCLDLESKRVTAGGTEVVLTAREYEILLLLMQSPKKIFTKANIFESIWKDDFLGDDNTVNVHMSHLRNKLTKANQNEEYIETIWGMGYRLKN